MRRWLTCSNVRPRRARARGRRPRACRAATPAPERQDRSRQVAVLSHRHARHDHDSPETIRPLSRAEYDRTVALGWFEDERIELLHGLLVKKSPQGPRHVSIMRCLNELPAGIREYWIVNIVDQVVEVPSSRATAPTARASSAAAATPRSWRHFPTFTSGSARSLREPRGSHARWSRATQPTPRG